MSEDKKPWWYPKPVTAETVQRLRKDYPEDTVGLDDEEVLERYELAGCRYQWLWDHIGEAAEQANHLADEIERLQALVKDAYLEGYGQTGTWTRRESSWNDSEAKTKL